MKRNLRIGGVLAALLLVVSVGCATSGQKLSDEELVRLQLDQWIAGLVEQDMDVFLATISESFSAPQAPDKQALGDFISQAIDAGYLDDAEVSLEDAQFAMEENECSVYPIDLMSMAGSVSVELIFVKEDGQWLIGGMEVDGL